VRREDVVSRNPKVMNGALVFRVEPAQGEVSCSELVEDHEPRPATTQDRGIWFHT
jgi:hypothetical protein